MIVSVPKLDGILTIESKDGTETVHATHPHPSRSNIYTQTCCGMYTDTRLPVTFPELAARGNYIQGVRFMKSFGDEIVSEGFVTCKACMRTKAYQAALNKMMPKATKSFHELDEMYNKAMQTLNELKDTVFFIYEKGDIHKHTRKSAMEVLKDINKGKEIPVGAIVGGRVMEVVQGDPIVTYEYHLVERGED